MAELALVGGGTFFCQAVATGFTGHIAQHAKAAAGGLYLTAYYAGGIVGATLLAAVYSFWGWRGCVAVIAGCFVLMGAVAGLFWDRSTRPTIMEPRKSRKPALKDAINTPPFVDKINLVQNEIAFPRSIVAHASISMSAADPLAR
jgi:MFS family permease